jgi:hypothetical protein
VALCSVFPTPHRGAFTVNRPLSGVVWQGLPVEMNFGSWRAEPNTPQHTRGQEFTVIRATGGSEPRGWRLGKITVEPHAGRAEHPPLHVVNNPFCQGRGIPFQQAARPMTYVMCLVLAVCSSEVLADTSRDPHCWGPGRGELSIVCL